MTEPSGEVSIKCPYCEHLVKLSVPLTPEPHTFLSKCSSPLASFLVKEGSGPCKRTFVVEVEWQAFTTIRKIEGEG